MLFIFKCYWCSMCRASISPFSQVQVFTMSRLLCPSLTDLFLLMGLWHFSWGSRGAGAAWRLGVLDVQVLGVTATAPLSPTLTQPGF